MRYTSTLPKTLTRLFDVFGSLDETTLRNVPFYATPGGDALFTCIAGEIGFSGSCSFWILARDGQFRQGWATVQLPELRTEAAVKELAEEISKKAIEAAAAECKETEYGPDRTVYDYGGFEGKVPDWAVPEHPLGGEWLQIVSETAATILDRMLRNVDDIAARLVRETSFSFRHMNLVCGDHLTEEGRMSIIDAAFRLPVAVGPILDIKRFRKAFYDVGDFSVALQREYGIGKEAERVLGLMSAATLHGESAMVLPGILATLGKMDADDLSRISEGIQAEGLYVDIRELAWAVAFAFSYDVDDPDSYSENAVQIGQTLIRMMARDGLVEDIIEGRECLLLKENVPYGEGYLQISECLLYAFVLPHMPEWVLARPLPSNLERLRHLVLVNLMLFGGSKCLREFGAIWDEFSSDIPLGWTMENADDELKAEFRAVLERVMPAPDDAYRAWMLVSSIEALGTQEERNLLSVEEPD